MSDYEVIPMIYARDYAQVAYEVEIAHIMWAIAFDIPRNGYRYKKGMFTSEMSLSANIWILCHRLFGWELTQYIAPANTWGGHSFIIIRKRSDDKE